MPDITESELYELFLDTIGKCTSEVRNRSDEEILYNLFEEFDVGAHTFLHDDNLAKLRSAGFIDDKKVAVSKEVRKRWLALQHQSWTVEDIRTKKEWNELFELCDQLVSGEEKGSGLVDIEGR